MSDTDYLDFRDLVIVARADETQPNSPHAIEIADLCERHSIPYQETWLSYCGPDIADAGYGKVFAGKRSWRLSLNAKGLARAAEIRRQRRPKGMLEKLHRVNWTTWSGVAGIVGVVIAIIALFVS